LEKIPYGTTTTCAALAAKLSLPQERILQLSAAVGGANPLLIIRPCHPVIGADSTRQGDADGIEYKATLLTHEWALMSAMPSTVPPSSRAQIPLDLSHEPSRGTDPTLSRTYILTGADGQPFASPVPGTLGGHRRGRLYGRLDCPSALKAIARGHYVTQRVFFTDEATAIAAGYRPCAVCLPSAYTHWKTQQGT
jgi:hypothetical protein